MMNLQNILEAAEAHPVARKAHIESEAVRLYAGYNQYLDEAWSTIHDQQEWEQWVAQHSFLTYSELRAIESDPIFDIYCIHGNEYWGKDKDANGQHELPVYVIRYSIRGLDDTGSFQRTITRPEQWPPVKETIIADWELSS